MGYKTLCFGLICMIFAYYIYTPISENIEEPWKVRLIDVTIKTASMVGKLTENMGLVSHHQLLSTVVILDYRWFMSDENVTVTETTFNGVPVCLYLPMRKSDSRSPAVIFIHGGASVMGSYKMNAYDFMNRRTANTLDAVVVGVDYRLSPQYQFPLPLEDIISAVKFFLQDEILATYWVDPNRIGISGDSSGGFMAAAVTTLVQNDPKFKTKFKVQALIYPCLQMVDLLLPSYQENAHGPVLSRKLAIELGSLYISKDKEFIQAMLLNRHMPLGSEHLFKLVNWSTLLPERFKKNHVYTEPVVGNWSNPDLLSYKTSPMIASDSQLLNLPQTYILTCQYDILRDDGFMYASRLRSLGLNVSHDHMEDGVHAAISFSRFPLYLRLGMRIQDKYIKWLKENL